MKNYILFSCMFIPILAYAQSSVNGDEIMASKERIEEIADEALLIARESGGLDNVRASCALGGYLEAGSAIDIPDVTDEELAGAVCTAVMKEEVANGNAYSLYEERLPEALKGRMAPDEFAIAIRNAASQTEPEMLLTVDGETRNIPIPDTGGILVDAGYTTTKTGVFP